MSDGKTPPASDAVELARLRRWAYHAGNTQNPLACAVRLLFTYYERLQDERAKDVATIADAERASRAAKDWQAKAAQLMAELERHRVAPWDDDGVAMEG